MAESEKASPISAKEKVCPCKVEIRGTVAWMKCKNEKCNYSMWHAACAGFAKTAKQSVLTTFGEWLCPGCIMKKFPSSSNGGASKTIINSLSAKLDKIKDELKNEIISQNQNLNEKFESCIELMVKNVDENIELKTTNSSMVNKIEGFQTLMTSKLDKLENKHQLSKTVEPVSCPIADEVNKKQEQETTINGTTHTDVEVGTITDEVLDAEELRQRERKKHNICLFRLPESQSLDDSEAYKEDMKKLKDVFFAREGFNPAHVKNAYRIGKKSANKIRPVVMQFTNLTTRLKVLKMDDIVYTSGSEETTLYVSTDKTTRQIAEHKKLYSELQMRREGGETDLVIRNNKIVQKQPFRPTLQSIWDITSESKV